MSDFKSKLSSFQTRFKSLLGAKAQGYDELNTLEQPLVSDVHEQHDYERQHGVGAPAGFRPAPGGYAPPPPASAGYPPQGYGEAPPAALGDAGGGVERPPAAPLPSQAEELQELAVLARDAAEILWEMVAMGEGGGAVADMKGKAEQLQAQLRGLIGDYQGGDEALFARAFESFDMLSRCLEEQNAPAQPPPAASAAPPSALAPPPGAAAAPPPAVAQPPADEAPLISFD
ncbi:programmed cell death 6 interacting [Micractinium conductrix]|uniref:Programmed cell death 6 interacting n=1 Tax=Micractinium conductrix TaxID=554055 RepID=A0A2P6V680_9CHLO|nr:programmed cell death 6 interacting [Micractinium conductrix]|eukprot:PSC69596.1 programmed cell death 6 interacting [Micractinium conductrix]